MGRVLQRWPCFNLTKRTLDSGVVAVLSPSFHQGKAQAVTLTTGNRGLLGRTEARARSTSF